MKEMHEGPTLIWLFFQISHKGGWCGNNSPDLYSKNIWFESWQD